MLAPLTIAPVAARLSVRSVTKSYGTRTVRTAIPRGAGARSRGRRCRAGAGQAPVLTAGRLMPACGMFQRSSSFW